MGGAKSGEISLGSAPWFATRLVFGNVVRTAVQNFSKASSVGDQITKPHLQFALQPDWLSLAVTSALVEPPSPIKPDYLG
jgi:hypothetical protein